MKHRESFSISKRLKSFTFAFKGVKYLILDEHNARIHSFLAVGVVLIGLYFNVSKIEWCLLTLCIVTVFAAEAFNSAIEKLADSITEDHHPLIGMAKDLAAAGVLLVSGGAAIVGVIIFYPYIYQLLFLP